MQTLTQRGVGLAATFGLIAFLAVSSIAFSATRTTTVSLRTTKLGPILVNSSGHTLYLFGKDTNGKSECSGPCAAVWLPLLSHGNPTAGSGVKASLLGTIKRSNGSLQLTYDKHPLYTYTADRLAGQTNGEGSMAFGAKWYALSARGTAIIKTTATTTTTNPYG